MHVPYKGTQPALADLLGGRMPVMFDGVITSLPQIKAGKLRPIAVASLTRSQLLPDVPTMTEAGLPGFEAVGLATVMAPAGTPPEIVNKISADIAAVLRMPDVREQLDRHGPGGGRQHAGGVLPIRTQRIGEVGQGDPRRQGQGGLDRQRQGPAGGRGVRSRAWSEPRRRHLWMAFFRDPDENLLVLTNEVRP